MSDQTCYRYAARRRRNGMAMTLSVGATIVGLGWLVLILGALLWQGFSGLSLAVFTQMTPPPGSAGGLLNPIIGSLILTVAGGRDRHADRHPRRHLHGGIWPLRPPDQRRALHQRHPAQRAVDRRRPLHLRNHGCADGAFLRLGRRRRAGDARHPGGRAHHRGHAARWCPTRCARRRPRSAAALDDDSGGSATARRTPAS